MPSQGGAPNIILGDLPSFQHLSLVSVALTPAAVGAATVTEQTFTVTGLSVGDALQSADQIFGLSKAAHQAGLALGTARVSAANTLAIQFINPTAASITPTAGETYSFTVFRPCDTANTNATVV